MNGIDFSPRHGITNATAWRLAVGLVRMHPERLRIIELHPGEGMYDCLTLIEADKPYQESGCLQLNRVGSAHVWRRFDHPSSDTPGPLMSFPLWGDAIASNVRPIVEALAERSGLVSSASLSSSTRRSVAYRVIEEFVGLGAFHDETWDASNGYLDTSGYGGGIQEQWFDDFPGARNTMRAEAEDLLGSPAYGYWFLRRDSEVVACLSESCMAWRPDGVSVDLYEEFVGSGRRVWPALYRLLGWALR